MFTLVFSCFMNLKTEAQEEYKTFYRSRDKKYSTSYTGAYDDWVVYDAEAYRTRIEYRRYIIQDEYLEYIDSYPNCSVEVTEKYTGSNYRFNTLKNGKGYNYYLPYWPSNKSIFVGQSVLINGVTTAYYMGSYNGTLYDIEVWTKYRYKLYKWGSWSEWSEEPIEATDERQVESRELKALDITYNTRGGYDGPQTQTKYEEIDTQISGIIPKRYEDTFLGWSVNSDASTVDYQPGDSFGLNEDTILYAVWQNNSPSILLDSFVSADITDGGKAAYYSYTPIESGTYVLYSVSDEDTVLTVYDLDGNEIADDDDGAGDSNFRLEYEFETGNTYIFEVKYHSKTLTGSIPFYFGGMYTLSFDAQGGEGAPISLMFDYGIEYRLSNKTPTKANKVFKGWSTTAGAVNPTHQPGDVICIESDVTLYAVWGETKSAFRIAAASLSLHNDISINFKVNGEVFSDNSYSEPYIEVTVEGSTTKITNWKIEESSGRYVFVFKNISPKMIGDTLTAKLYAKDSDGNLKESEELEYGVKKYCQNQLSKTTTTDEFRTLIVDLLNYGAATQLYTDYKTGDLTNAFLGEADLEFATESVDLSEFDGVSKSAYETISDPTIQLHGANLLLNDSITMRFSVSVADESDFDGVNVIIEKADGSKKWVLNTSEAGVLEYQTIQNGRYRYYVRFDGLNATEMSDTLYMRFVDSDENAVSNTLRYSIGCYAYSKQNDKDPTLAELVKAMMKYGNSARAWLATTV